MSFIGCFCRGPELSCASHSPSSNTCETEARWRTCTNRVKCKSEARDHRLPTAEAVWGLAGSGKTREITTATKGFFKPIFCILCICTGVEYRTVELPDDRETEAVRWRSGPRLAAPAGVPTGTATQPRGRSGLFPTPGAGSGADLGSDVGSEDPAGCCPCGTSAFFPVGGLLDPSGSRSRCCGASFPNPTGPLPDAAVTS